MRPASPSSSRSAAWNWLNTPARFRSSSRRAVAQLLGGAHGVEVRVMRMSAAAAVREPYYRELIIPVEALADGCRPALTAALAHVTDRERDAVQLRVVGGAGCCEDAACMRVHRGVARLARLLEATPAARSRSATGSATPSTRRPPCPACGVAWRPRASQWVPAQPATAQPRQSGRRIGDVREYATRQPARSSRGKPGGLRSPPGGPYPPQALRSANGVGARPRGRRRSSSAVAAYASMNW